MEFIAPAHLSFHIFMFATDYVYHKSQYDKLRDGEVSDSRSILIGARCV